MNRFRILLAVAALLVVARFALPLQDVSSPEIVDAAAPRRGEALNAEAARVSSVAEMALDEDRPGNAFPVRGSAGARTPKAEPAADPNPIPRPVIAAAPMTVAPVAAPSISAPSEDPVPFRVIGTWDDGGPKAAFMATPSGTRIVRQGSDLSSGYRVVSVTDSAVVLSRGDAQQRVSLPIRTGVTP